MSGGLYVYFLLLHYGWAPPLNQWLTMSICVAALAIIYMVKFCALKFTGWVTGEREAINTYIFIVFLINKIIGIFLLPLFIIMAFADEPIVEVAVIISILCTGLLLVMRFLRSYGLVQGRLKISRIHFFLFIIGVELLPILVIWKAIVLLLVKKH